MKILHKIAGSRYLESESGVVALEYAMAAVTIMIVVSLGFPVLADYIAPGFQEIAAAL